MPRDYKVGDVTILRLDGPPMSVKASFGGGREIQVSPKYDVAAKVVEVKEDGYDFELLNPPEAVGKKGDVIYVSKSKLQPPKLIVPRPSRHAREILARSLKTTDTELLKRGMIRKEQLLE